MNVREVVHPALCNHRTIGYFVFQGVGDYYRRDGCRQEHPDGRAWAGAW